MFDPYGTIVLFLFVILIPAEVLVLLLSDALKAISKRKAQKRQQSIKPVEPEPTPEHDVSYGEDTFDQEDDEFHEEVF